MPSASAPAPKKTIDIVQQGIKELYCPANPDVDIVAVPGLGAHPLECWKSADPKLEFNWLTDRDGLAKEFPRARILLYMYQSAWTAPFKVRQFMSNLSQTLLYGLKEKRKDDAPRRPIVFLGHSMGGIIIAKAISMAEGRREHFGKMFEAITGCIFFGTPFDGAPVAAVASMFAQISEAVGSDQATASKLLDLMKPGDESLRDIRNELVRLSTKMSPKIELWCFYEERQTDWSRQVGLPFSVPIPKKYADFVTRESATLTGVDSMGLARTHRELVKFDSFKDPVYQLVRGPLKTIINKAPLIAKNRFNSTRGIDGEVVTDVLKELEGVNVDKKRKKATQGVISSLWILQEQEYKQWLEKNEYRRTACLWVLGPEGKGKLGASLAAIDHIEEVLRQEELQNSGQAANLFAYFLCDQTSEDSTPEELLKSLLRQLISQQQALAVYAKHFVNPEKRGTTRGNKQAGLTVENLWQSLQDMLTDEIIGTVYFVVNNFHLMDEQTDSVKKLMAMISSEWQESGSPRAHVRWLFTSQMRHSIKQALESQCTSIINLDDAKYGNQVQQELKLHAQKKIAELGVAKGYNKALTYFAGSLIGKRAQNTQWIDITIIQLAELPINAKDLKVRSLLERIPQDLRSLLDRAWLSVLDPKDDQLEEIKEMLRTLIITYEEPTEHDLAMLTGLSHDAESRAHLCILVEKCRPLLIFRKPNNRIGFMNSFVKAHLLENAERLLSFSAEEVRWQHGIVALRSFSYITQFFADREPEKTATVTQDQNQLSDASFIPNSDFTGIVAQKDMSLTGPEQNTAPLIQEPVTEIQGGVVLDPLPSSNEETQFKYEYDDDDDDYSEYEEEKIHTDEPTSEVGNLAASSYAIKHWLHHASKATTDIAETLSQEEEFWEGDSMVRKRWLQAYHKLTDAFYGVTLEGLTGLHVAASVGFSQLVSVLIKNGHKADIDVRDKYSNTPLHLAAYLGRPNICEVLLNNGAKIDDGQDEGEQTPLSMAACKGHCKVMIKLLDRGANPNASAKGILVINDAIVSGNLEAVRLLVEHRAILAHDDDNDDNLPPLALSALLSDLTMFTYLLEACASKIPGKEYSNALISSAYAGRLEVTKRLLQFQHDTETFQCALEAAASEENWDILLLIIANSTGLYCDGVFYKIATGSEQQDALLSAIWKHTNGAISQETLDQSLYDAVDREKASTVKLLLEEFGANANATGKEYGNALTAAAFDGTLEIVRMLLDHGADANSPDGWALQTAAQQGHLKVVELLVQHGADVNACLPEGKFLLGTALQAACQAGKIEIVSFLLEHGADPNMGAGPETCPITAACRRGEAKILERLIASGATINRFGGPEWSSPLIEAAGTLYKDSLEKLLNAGADINLVNNDGNTALIVAADVGDAEVVAFLLEKGADITHVNKKNMNALQTAMNAGATDCFQLLVRAVTRVLTTLNKAIHNQSHEAKRVLSSVDFSGLLPAAEGQNTEGEKTDESAEVTATTNKSVSPVATSEKLEIGCYQNDTQKDEATQAFTVEESSSQPANGVGSHETTYPGPQQSLQTTFMQEALSTAIQKDAKFQQAPLKEVILGVPDHRSTEDVVPSSTTRNPDLPTYQAYQDSSNGQPAGTDTTYSNIPAVTEESPVTQCVSSDPLSHNPADSGGLAHAFDYAESATLQTVSQSYPDTGLSISHSNQFPSAPPQLTIADQIQTYQTTQDTKNSPIILSFQSHQSNQTYQRPTRKPLGSSSISLESAKHEPPSGNEVHQNHFNYQDYQGQHSYQTPPPSQLYQSPQLKQEYQYPGGNQEYQSPVLNQDYQNSLSNQGYPNHGQDEGYRSPSSSQDYQHHRLPNQHYQNYQADSTLSYSPVSTIPAQQPLAAAPKPSFGYRLSSYFQSSSPDQSNQKSGFRYNGSW